MTTPQLLQLIDDTLLDHDIKATVAAYRMWDLERLRRIAEYSAGGTSDLQTI